MKKFTVSEVRELAKHMESVGWRPDSNGDRDCYDEGAARSAEMLFTFADMLEAQEKAVPVAECGHSSTVEHRASNANVTGSSPAARSNSDAERLAEALRQIAVTTKGYPNASREGEIAIKALAAPSAQPQAPAASVPDVDVLAQEIRRVDGDHKMGAARLAEHIVQFLAAQENPNGL